MIINEIILFVKIENEEEFYSKISELKFINQNSIYHFQYRNLLIEVEKSRYTTDKKIINIKFKFDINFYIDYKKISQRLLKHFSFHLVESIYLFNCNIKITELSQRLHKLKFKKPYEELDTLVFDDATSQIVISLMDKKDNLYQYESFISGSNIDLLYIHKYIDKLHKSLA